MEQQYAKVCANCGLIVMATDSKGKDVCPVCDSHEFKNAPLPEKISCIYCKTEYTLEQLMKMWITIPFYDAKTQTFYCGCRGWE